MRTSSFQSARTLRPIFGLLSFVLFLGGCGSTLDNLPSGSGSTTSSTTLTDTYGVTVDWGSDDTVKSGIGVSGLTLTPLEDAQGGEGREPNFPTCFDNARPCRRATANLQVDILNNPTPVQAFQLNFTLTDYSVPGRTYSQIVIDAASVTTAELRFKSATGELSLGTPYTKQLVNNTTCSLSSANAVGYASTSGSEKILVGLRLMEEGQLSSGSSSVYFDAHLTAARAWHSGVYPDGSQSGVPLGFKFLPTDDAATQDFGVDSFTDSSQGVAVSPKFGLSSSDSVSGGYKNHVIIGWCLQGRKIGTTTRPLLLYAESFVRRPKLKKVQ